MNMTVVPRLRLAWQLGEGLHWDAERQCLWGVDIHGCQVWRWAGDVAAAQAWRLPLRVGWVLPVAGRSQHVLLGLQGGLAWADAVTLQVQAWLHQPFGANPSLRLNDAKADATGSVWCGSLNNDDETRSDGCLYRLAPDGSLAVVDTGYTVANGPAISADGRLMLHTDSGRRTIYAFELDAPAGRLTGKRVWKVFTQAEGYPDGMTFDAEGCVWVAHWGAACVSRFAPDGALLARVVLPTSHVTNVCFGGPGLGRLFVSTARAGLSAAQLAREPLVGALFEVLGHGTVGLPGLPYRPEPAALAVSPAEAPSPPAGPHR
jgi:D-xylonolactonase